jgi:hypothetical protein
MSCSRNGVLGKVPEAYSAAFDRHAAIVPASWRKNVWFARPWWFMAGGEIRQGLASTCNGNIGVQPAVRLKHLDSTCKSGLEWLWRHKSVRGVDAIDPFSIDKSHAKAAD